MSDVLATAKLDGPAARAVLTDVWTAALSAFVADDLITEAESGYLRQLRTSLGVTDTEVAAIEASVVHPRYQKSIRDALADERLSPDEEAALHALAEEFGVKLMFNGARNRALDTASLYWQIENGHAPVVSVPISLQRGEKCHFMAPASWYELRTHTTRVNYSGPTARIRICKGVYYRFGSIAPQRITSEELTHIDDGTLYVTSKRIIFDGARRNHAIRYSALIGFQVYADGIGLEKARGKSPRLTIDGDVTQAAVTIGAMLAKG